MTQKTFSAQLKSSLRGPENGDRVGGRLALALQARFQSLTVTPDFENNTVNWVVNQAKKYNLPYLLAYADDGVIWGEARGDDLALSGDAFPDESPALNPATLQQARLFGPEAELLLWRTENGFAARLLTEVDSDQTSCLEEHYLLWGTHQAEITIDGFSLLREGKQGLMHPPPVYSTQQKDAPVNRLSVTVRHYLDHDIDGQTYIKTSRLVQLNNGGENG